jgi:hypothetical protein
MGGLQVRRLLPGFLDLPPQSSNKEWKHAHHPGVENSNQAGMQAGTQLHEIHGRQVAATSGLQLLAGILLLAALVLFGFLLFKFL